jgi:hypothetical protein
MCADDHSKLVSIHTQESSSVSAQGHETPGHTRWEKTHTGQYLTMRMSPVTICMPPTVPIPPKPEWGGPQGGLDSQSCQIPCHLPESNCYWFKNTEASHAAQKARAEKKNTRHDLSGEAMTQAPVPGQSNFLGTIYSQQ